MKRQAGATLIEVLVAGVFLFVFFGGGLLLGLNGCRSTVGRYEIRGDVRNVDKRMDSATQKFAVSLSSISVISGSRDVASFGETAIVNCSSTQCSSLNPGDVVILSCFKEYNGIQFPSEEECRYARILPQ